MKKIIITGLFLVLGNMSSIQAQFNSTSNPWNIPIVSDSEDYYVSSSFHQVFDINGDGKVDFIDSENQNSSASDVFLNGNQKYWKVYLGNGSGFSATATQWNIPIVSDSEDYFVSSSFHQVVDMNGDGKPDFVDSENEATSASDVFLNGNQKYWKVYLNTGTGFSATATQWNIPIVSDSSDYMVSSDLHQVVDLNGDGKPDFVDSENEATSASDVFLNGNQKYWKVYLNTGSGFSATATQWNIPIVSDDYDFIVSYSFHQIIDMNGDGKLDFVDSENQNSSASDVFLNGNQKYWKVYLNNGTGFSATATQWNIPIVSDDSDYYVSSDFHTTMDMNGDGKPDFVDSENQNSSSADVFLNGNQKYWKVYLNNGAGFNATSVQWNIPIVSDTEEYFVSASFHRVMDFDGDGKVDFIDSENEATSSADVFLNGNQKYWKVYSNTSVLAMEDFNESTVLCYPNPVQDQLNLKATMPLNAVKIYAITGQLMVSKTVNSPEVSLDFSALSPGMYIVHAQSEKGLQIVKISKR
ncbi:MAG: hypothetical protein RLZZ500_855 [Bacteroidota bacterium]|jgi:hypothetical protein